MKSYHFFRSVYADNAQRSKSSRRALSRDLVRYALNRVAEPLDIALCLGTSPANYPLVFIVGAPRTGTTLLHQLMAQHLRVGFVNNAMAKFWAAPLLGSVLHGDKPFMSTSYPSDLGGTSGAAAPHEFSWFWHYHADFGRDDELTPEQIETASSVRIQQSLRALAAHAGRPFVFKNVNHVTFQVSWISKLLPESRFVWTKRERIQTAASILRSRKARYGDAELWWATRPRGYREWCTLSPQQQIARQVCAIEASLSHSFASLAPSRTAVVEYEGLVDAPQAVLRELASFAQTSVTDESALQQLQLTRRERSDAANDVWLKAFSECERSND